MRDPTLNGDILPRLEMSVNAPFGVACDASGNLFVAEAGSHRVLAIARDGAELFVAGTRVPAGFAGRIAGSPDGQSGSSDERLPPRFTHLDQPIGIAVTPSRTLYVTELGGRRLLRFGL